MTFGYTCACAYLGGIDHAGNHQSAAEQKATHHLESKQQKLLFPWDRGNRCLGCATRRDVIGRSGRSGFGSSRIRALQEVEYGKQHAGQKAGITHEMERQLNCVERSITSSRRRWQ